MARYFYVSAVYFHGLVCRTRSGSIYFRLFSQSDGVDCTYPCRDSTFHLLGSDGFPLFRLLPFVVMLQICCLAIKNALKRGLFAICTNKFDALPIRFNLRIIAQWSILAKTSFLTLFSKQNNLSSHGCTRISTSLPYSALKIR